MAKNMDKVSKEYLAAIGISEAKFYELVKENIQTKKGMVKIHVNDDDIRILRVYTNKKGLTIVSLSGMEWILIGDCEFLRIPASIYEGCTLGEVRSILDGEDSAPIDLSEVLTKLNGSRMLAANA